MSGSISRWRPLADLSDLREWMEQSFGDDGEAWNPRVDVVKKESEIVLKADLPGVKPEDIKVEVEDGVLTVSGEREEKTEQEDDRYLRRERRYGSFSRSMALPQGVKGDDIEANTNDGVLELKIPLPKPEEKSKHTVKVKAEK